MMKKTKMILAVILAGLISSGVQACGISKLLHKGNLVEDTIHLDAVSVLNADLSCADITIRRGSENKLYYKMNEELVPEIMQENGTLTVKKSSHINRPMLFDREHKLEITLDSKTLDSLDISLTSGDICVDGFNFGGRIHTTSGDISVYHTQNGSELTLESTSGEIELRGCKFQSIYKKQVSGDTRMEQVETGQLYLQSTSGEHKITQAVVGDMEIKCTSGDTELELIGSEDDYNYALSCTSGDIRVADTKSGKKYERNHNADYTITAKTTSGDFRLRFSE